MIGSPAERPGPVGLHRDPPCAPGRLLLSHHPWLVAAAALGFLVLALAAVVAGPALAAVDRPVQELAFEVRSAPLTSSFRVVTELGGAMVTTVVAMVAAAVVWRRCQALALLVLITVLGRSVLSFGLKAVVDRPRPDLEPLATVSSASFPSGHVLAAVALWGLLPPVVGVLTSNRRVWWASVALSAIIVASVGASRIYLGVHWLTDVVGSLLVGLLLLWVIEVVLERLHRSDGCHRLLHDPGGRTSPAAS